MRSSAALQIRLLSWYASQAVYDEICKSIIKLEESKDVEKSEKTLNEALDYEVAQMDKMLQKATSVLEALKTFETDSIKDRDNIADEDRKLAAELLTIEGKLINGGIYVIFIYFIQRSARTPIVKSNRKPLNWRRRKKKKPM